MSDRNAAYEAAMIEVKAQGCHDEYNEIDNHVLTLETRLRESRDLALYQKGKFDKVVELWGKIRDIETWPLKLAADEKERLRLLKEQLTGLTAHKG